MKNLIITLSCLWLATSLFAQTLTISGDGKTASISGSTAGCLVGTTVLSAAQKLTVTSLTISSGSIDASDMKVMRDNMTALTTIDMGNATVAAYTGTIGTDATTSETYYANSIPIRAFVGSTRLASIILPSTIVSILDYAFHTNIALPSITIPASVTYIPRNAFERCTALINVDPANPNYSSQGGVLFNKSKTRLMDYPISLTGAYTVPSTVTTIGDFAFYSFNNNLTSITFPASLTSIEMYAFNSNSALTTINSYATTPPTLGGAQFGGISTTTCKIYVPSTSVATYQAAAGWNSFTISALPTLSISGDGKTATITSATPGCLVGTSILSDAQKLSITNLTIASGSIDARDINVLKTAMTSLTTVDLTNVNIAAYTGTAGTNGTTSQTYAANAIPPSAFQGCSRFTTIYLPTSTTSIEDFAFHFCSGLTALSIPPSVATIKSWGFFGCDGISNIDIPAATTSIYDPAFSGFRGTFTVNASNPNYSAQDGVLFNKTKTTIIAFPAGYSGAYSIPSTVTSTGNYTFNYCYGLTGITFPSSVTTIGNYSFGLCIGLSTFNIPATLTSIGTGSLTGCKGLFVVDPQNPNYSSLDGVIFNKSKTTLIIASTSISTNYSIPSTVTTINATAFDSNTTLNTISIPSTVTTIGDQAFHNCYSLQKIYSYRATPPTVLGNDAFNNANTGACILYVPSGSTATYHAANQWSVFSTVSAISPLTISADGKTATITYATAGCLLGTTTLSAAQKLSITNLTIDAGSIDARDLKVMRDSMPALTEIDNSNVSIAAYTGTAGPNPFNGGGSYVYAANVIPVGAFYFCGRLKSILLPATATKLESYSFCATGLSSIFIPALTTEVGGAFPYCSLYYNVDAANQTYSSQDGVLFNKDKTTLYSFPIPQTGTYVIPSSVTTTAAYAFSSSKLSGITIPATVTTIGDHTFQSCANITAYNIPATTTNIQSFAFYDTPGLVNVDASNPNYSSQGGVFFNKAKTTIISCPTSISGTYTIPSTVTTTSESVFMNCTLLNTLIIPSSVQNIASWLFNGCYNLTKIYDYANLPPSAAGYAFYTVPTSCAIYVPNGSIPTYKAAAQWNGFTNYISMLSVSASSANLAKDAGSNSSVTVTTDGSWTASSDQAWLTLGTTSGTGNGSTTFTATANPTAATRTAIITFSRVGGETTANQTVTVTQDRATSYLITITTPTNGTILVKNGTTTINSGDYVLPATVLTVTTTPSTDYGQSTLTANGSAIVSNSVTINAATTIAATFVKTTYTWVGTTSTAWSTASNWDLSTVPTAANNVIIPSTTNKPTISGTANCNNLTINSGSILTIPAGTTLNVAGSITNNAGTSGLVIKADQTGVTANGSLIFHNTQAAGQEVPATVEMYSKASWDLNAAIGSKYRWQYFGIPVRSTVAEPTLTGSVVRRAEESGNTSATRWIQLNATSTLTSFTGYEIVQALATKYTFTGQLENSSPTKTLTYTAGATYPGLQIVGNPYTAAIDIKQLVFGTQAEASVYLYNTGALNEWSSNSGSTVGANPGQYTAATQATAGSGGIPSQIPSMQAFVVKAISNNATATLNIPYSSAVLANVDKQRVPAADTKTYSIIDVKGTRFADRMWIFTDPSCTRTYDNGWDGRKMLGASLTPQLCAMESDGDYQIDAVADVNNTELGFMAGEDAEYTLTFTHNNITTTYGAIYLVDLVANKTVDVTASGSAFTFTAQPTTTLEKRFKIITTAANTTEIKQPNTTNVNLFSYNKTIVIKNNTNYNGELTIYDVAGRFIQSFVFNANDITNLSTYLKQGTYLIKAKCENGTQLNQNILIH